MTEEQFLTAQELRQDIKRLEEHAEVIEQQESPHVVVGLGYQPIVFSKFVDWDTYMKNLTGAIKSKMERLEAL